MPATRSSMAAKIVSKEAYEEERNRLDNDDKQAPTFVPPTPATCSTQFARHHQGGRAVRQLHLRGPASRKTTKVLTEAGPSPGKVDYLVGLKGKTSFLATWFRQGPASTCTKKPKFASTPGRWATGRPRPVKKPRRRELLPWQELRSEKS